MLLTESIQIDDAILDAFCSKWRVATIETFESGGLPGYDVHLLVNFQHGARWGLLDHSRMEQELSELSGRTVELVSRRAIETSKDAWLKKSILESARLVYPHP